MNSPLTPTTRREFTGPRGDPREKSIKSVEKGSGSSSAFRAASSSSFSSEYLASRSEARPARRFGPWLKISSLHFFVILTLFLLHRLWPYSQPIIQYYPWFAVLLYFVPYSRLVQRSGKNMMVSLMNNHTREIYGFGNIQITKIAKPTQGFSIHLCQLTCTEFILSARLLLTFCATQQGVTKNEIYFDL